jgi:hypothetical protein
MILVFEQLLALNPKCGLTLKSFHYGHAKKTILKPIYLQIELKITQILFS